jgi:hypothetical protein
MVAKVMLLAIDTARKLTLAMSSCFGLRQQLNSLNFRPESLNGGENCLEMTPS